MWKDGAHSRLLVNTRQIKLNWVAVEYKWQQVPYRHESYKTHFSNGVVQMYLIPRRNE